MKYLAELLKVLVGLLCLSLASIVQADDSIDDQAELDPNRVLLPENFPVYVEDNVVVNVPYPGFAPKTLPTVNEFQGYPGCYIAAYSHNEEDSVYGVGGDIFVMGQVRVPGRYEGRICRPKGYETADISALPEFKELLRRSLPACKDGSCWAGGDTGGWFGIE